MTSQSEMKMASERSDHSTWKYESMSSSFVLYCPVVVANIASSSGSREVQEEIKDACVTTKKKTRRSTE